MFGPPHCECRTKPTNTRVLHHPERLTDWGKQSRKYRHWSRNWLQPANKSQLDTSLHVKCCNCWEHSSPPSKICLHCPVRDLVLLELLCLNSTLSFSKRLVSLEDFLQTNSILVEVMCCVVFPQPKQIALADISMGLSLSHRKQGNIQTKMPNIKGSVLSMDRWTHSSFMCLMLWYVDFNLGI